MSKERPCFLPDSITSTWGPSFSLSLAFENKRVLGWWALCGFFCGVGGVCSFFFFPLKASCGFYFLV